MSRRDLPVSELNTGTIRRCIRGGKGPQRLQIKNTSEAHFCLDCGKYGHRTEEEARQLIGMQLKRDRLNEPGSFAVHPYLCCHGWWHFGRDRKTLERFAKLLEKNDAKG